MGNFQKDLRIWVFQVLSAVPVPVVRDSLCFIVPLFYIKDWIEAVTSAVFKIQQPKEPDSELFEIFSLSLSYSVSSEAPIVPQCPGSLHTLYIVLRQQPPCSPDALSQQMVLIINNL